MSEDRDLKAELDAAQQRADRAPGDPVCMRELAAALFAYGKTVYANGERDKAVAMYEEAKTLFKKSRPGPLSDNRYKALYLMLLNALLRYYEEKNEPERVFEQHEDILDFNIKRIKAAPDNYDYIRNYISSADRAAKSFEKHGRPDLLLRSYEERLELFRALSANDPDDKSGYSLFYNTELDRVIGIYRDKKDTARLIGLDKEKAELCRRIAALYPEYSPAFSGAALAYRELGELTGKTEYFLYAMEYAKRFPDDPECRRIIEDAT